MNARPQSQSGTSAWSAGSIDVGAMVDVDHPNSKVVVVDLGDDTICADLRRVESGQVAPERLSHSLWVLEKGTQHEIEYGDRDLLG